jgi:uncharacterized protein
MKNDFNFGVSDIDQVISILRKNPRIGKIILFGSRAKGNYRSGSDVDLSISGKDLHINDILNASIEIDQLNLPYKFDLIIHERIKEPLLLEHINRVGIVLYERKADFQLH